MTEHQVATREEWLAARKQLLEREKELTRRSDELARERRELPWVRVEKEYTFDTDGGTKTLAELFDGRSQLLVYHFMFGPEYTKGGCPTCSSMADAFDGLLPHLNNRDVTFLAISRAPLEQLQAIQAAHGLAVPVGFVVGQRLQLRLRRLVHEGAAAGGSIEYNYRSFDPAPLLQAGGGPVAQNAAATGTDVAGYTRQAPGMSAFALEDDAVYHTYSSFARGVEFLMYYYPLLDRAPKGRNEGGELWMRRHDEYPAGT